MKPSCMNCQFYKVEDALSGHCRATAQKNPDQEGQKRMVSHDYACSAWVDCGQHYYIRLGWIKAQEKKKTADTRQ